MIRKAAQQSRHHRARARRWAQRVAFGSLGLILLLALALYLLLANLDQPSVSNRLHALLRDSIGIELSYGSLDFDPLSHIVGTDLKIATPGAWAEFAPYLLEIGTLEAHWEPTSITGNISVTEVVMSDVSFSLVIDEKGGSSLDPLSTSDESESEEAPRPISHSLEALPRGLRLNDGRIDNITLNLIELEGGQRRRVTTVSGLDLTVSTELQDDFVRLKTTVSSPNFVQAGPRDTKTEQVSATKEDDEKLNVLLLSRTEFLEHSSTTHTAVLALNSILALDDSNLSFSMEGRLDHHDFPDLLFTEGLLLSLSTKLAFQPDAGQVAISIGRLELLQDAVNATADLRLEDEGTNQFRTIVSRGDIRLRPTRLIPLLSLPEDLKLESAPVTLGLSGLALSPDDFSPEGGNLTLDTSANISSSIAELQNAKLHLEAEVTAPMTFSLRGRLPVDGWMFKDPGLHVSAGSSELELEARDLRIPLESPERASGEIEAGLHTTAFALKAGDYEIRDGDLGIELSSRLDGSQSYGALATLIAPALIVREASHSKLVDLSGSSLQSELTRLELSSEDSSVARGSITANLQLGEASARATLDKTPDKANYDLDLNLPTLGPFRTLLADALPSGSSINWAAMGATFTSRGQLLDLQQESPSIRANAELALRRMAFRQPDLSLRLPELKLESRYEGTETHGQADLNLLLTGLRLNDFPMGARIEGDVNAGFDLVDPGVKMDLRLQGGPFERVHLEGKGSFDNRRKRLKYSLDAGAERPTRLGDLLVAFQLEEHRIQGTPTIALTSNGELEGVLRSVSPETGVEFFPEPANSASGSLHTTLDVKKISYQNGDLRVQSPSVDITTNLALQDGGFDGDLTLHAPAFDYESGADRIQVKDLAQTLELSTAGPLETSVLSLNSQVSAGSLRQNITDIYPPAGLQAELLLNVDRLLEWRLDRLHLESPEGGTVLELAGTVEQPSVGGALTLRGRLTQDLTKLSGNPATFSGTGLATIPFTLESPNQRLFQADSTLEMEKASLRIPGEEVALEDITGHIVFEEEFLLDDESNLTLLPLSRRNAYVRASFANTHPFLTGDSYLSIRHGEIQGTAFGPFASNIRLDHNVLRLDQLQMSLLEGSVTGQLLLDYLEGDTQLLFRGNAAGLLLSSDKERLDANLALNFAYDKLELNGRAHVVQIGRKTLLELLDALDPYHEDVSINRVRQGLAVGYPKYARLTFDHGFMSLKVELGGMVEAIRIDEIRGLAVGPILNRYLGAGSEPINGSP